MSTLIPTYRLGPERGDGRHPYVNKSGAFLGPGIGLLIRRTDRIGQSLFEPRPPAELEALLVAGFGPGFRGAGWAIQGNLWAVARALDDGDIGRAAISLLHARLPALPGGISAARIEKTERALVRAARRARAAETSAGKANFNPDEPRVPVGQADGGEWTDGGASTSDAADPDAAGNPKDKAYEQPLMDTGEQLAGGADPGRRKIDPYPAGPDGPHITFINDRPANPSPDQPVTTATAQMIEDAVVASGVDSVNINSTTGGVHAASSLHYLGQAVDIDEIDGLPVSDPRNAENVAKLQAALQEQPNIKQNFGPAQMTITNPDGTTSHPSDPKLAQQHERHIHAGGQR
ncbi:MAG TPA: hypothetical protein VMF53_03170 [Alphaproteobacteria bacterium]|nr:hypothetical protein [Alphaproteobacteria bacterium]